MSCAREIFRSRFRVSPVLASALLAALAALGPMSVALGAPLPSLFAATVPESDAQRAAQQAMREVLIRLMGSRQAAEDPALAALIGDASHYVQLERSTTRGATQVIFDEATLRAAVAATGLNVWNPDRPLVWVELPALSAAATEEMRSQISAAAEMRGLPIALVSADNAPAADIAPAAGAAAAADNAALLAVARRAGASAVLLAQPVAADSEALQWTLIAPAAEGHWVGGASAAIDGATDALALAARELDRAPLAEVECRIAGVADLPDFTAVLDSISAAPGVTEVSIRSIDADRLTLQLKAHGTASTLAHILASERLLSTGVGNAGVLDYRYQTAHPNGP
jgi:hypothetical protein